MNSFLVATGCDDGRVCGLGCIIVRREHSMQRPPALFAFVLCVFLPDAVRAAGNAGGKAVDLFLDDLRKGGKDKISFLFEVGANNGLWSNHVMKRAQQACPGGASRVRLTLIEPQQVFAARLRAMASLWRGTFFPAAAWTNETTLSFFLSSFSEASSLSEQMALTFNEPELHPEVRSVSVPTIDLAHMMLSAVHGAAAARGSVFLKLDVESAEYDLLPRLLTSGALCLCDYILIEWHLNAVAPGKRLAGERLDSWRIRSLRTLSRPA